MPAVRRSVQYCSARKNEDCRRCVGLILSVIYLLVGWLCTLVGKILTVDVMCCMY